MADRKVLDRLDTLESMVATATMYYREGKNDDAIGCLEEAAQYLSDIIAELEGDDSP